MNDTVRDQAAQTHRFTHTEMRSILALASVYMARMLGLFMILPVFAIYANDLGDVPPVLIGLAIGVYGLAQACLQIPLGALSDRIGRKKVIVGGLILFATGSVVAGLTDNIYIIIFGRFLQGSGAIASAIMALVSDVTRNEVRTKAMALIGASIGAAFLLALVLGPVIFSLIGIQGIFFSTAVLACLAIALVLLLIPIEHVPKAIDVSVEKFQLNDLFKNLYLCRLNIGVFVLHCVLTASFIAIPLLLMEVYTIGVNRHSIVYAAVFLLSFVGMWPLLKFFDKSSEKFSILLIFILFLSQALFALFDVQFALFALFLVLFFVAFNSLEASMPSTLSKLVHPARKGAAMGVYASSQFLGAFTGGALGGLIYQSFGLQELFLMNALLSLIWLLISVLATKK